MKNMDCFEDANFAVTLCDKAGIIVYMNKKSVATFSEEGGADLIGKSLLDCHPEPARTKLLDLLNSPRVNIYTIEKKNIQKMIYQAPWVENGQIMGLIELSLPLVGDIPHFVRD